MELWVAELMGRSFVQMITEGRICGNTIVTGAVFSTIVTIIRININKLEHLMLVLL